MNQITSSYESRTDLALEASESLRGTEEADSGILMEEEYKQAKNLRITSVRITTKEAERVVGKPKGTYITLESSELLYADEDYHREISEELSRQIRRLIKGVEKSKNHSLLVVGLGNKDVTPDALGPLVADNLCINRHLNGDGGDCQGNCEGDKAHCGNCGRCSGGEKHNEAEHDDSDSRYWYSSRFRGGKSQAWAYKGEPWGAGACHWSSHCGGRGDNRGGCDGTASGHYGGI